MPEASIACMNDYTFEYSQEFVDSIIELHHGKESLPSYKKYIADHLGGPGSRLSLFVRYLYPEIEFHCGDLSSKKVLDFGCGTGASTAALAMHCKNVVAFDIDEKSVAICNRRLKEHGLSDRVKIPNTPNFDNIRGQIGTFDFILVNGVIEHIPLSKPGLRKQTIQMLFDILNVSGYLYINDTPNRLWPKDSHTTNLWWIPWTKPGSRWAYLKATRAQRHVDNPEIYSNGPLGLEERGTWGATYFEIKKYLSGKSFQVVNLLPGHNRHIIYTQRKFTKRFFEFIVYFLFSKWTRIPLTGLAPFLNSLIIQKTKPKTD